MNESNIFPNDTFYSDISPNEINIRILQLIQEFFTPFLSLIALILRIICIMVYLKPVKNSFTKIIRISYESINKTLLLNSISQAIFSFTYIFLPVFYCRSLCISSSYISNFYYVYIILYGSTVVEMVSILANIFMCLNRYLIIFKHKNTFNFISFRKMCLLIILFSLLINLPYLFMVNIQNESSVYSLTNSAFSKSELGKFFNNFIPIVRYFVLVLIFLIINFLLLYRSYKYAKNKEKVIQNKKAILIMAKTNTEKVSLSSVSEEPMDGKSSSENTYKIDKSEWNLTRMSLFMCLIYIVNVLFIPTTFLNSKFNVKNFSLVVALELISAIMVQLTNLLEILSYFLFNKNFYRNFKSLFKFFIRFSIKRNRNYV